MTNVTAQIFDFEIWRFYDFSVFFENFDIKTKLLWISQPLSGDWQGTIRGCKAGFQIWMLKFFSFLDMAFLMIQKSIGTWKSQPYGGVLSG